MYDIIHSTDKIMDIFNPVFTLTLRETTDFIGFDKSISKDGNYTTNMIAQFEVQDIGKLNIPNERALSAANTIFDIIQLVHSQDDSKVMFIYLKTKKITHRNQFEKATQNLCKSIAGYHNLVNFKKVKMGKRTDGQITQFIQDQRGNSPGLVILNILPQHLQPIKLTIMKDEKDKVIDMEQFVEKVYVVFVNNLITADDSSLNLYASCVFESEKRNLIRLTDFEPLLLQLWTQSFEFQIRQSNCESLLKVYGKQQFLSTFRSNQIRLTSAFFTHVVGNNNACMPHPCKTLFTKTQQLKQSGCFDMSLYDISTQTLNWMISSYLVAKNMLSKDGSQYKSGNHGSTFLVGAAGSGKSRQLAILNEFFKGFQINNSTSEGLGSFQGPNIIRASFIWANEIKPDSLVKDAWKQLGDLEQDIKVKIKQAHDLDVKQGSTTICTGNFDVKVDLIDRYSTKFDDLSISECDGEFKKPCKPDRQLDVNACLRRWCFIRYSASWAQVHHRILDQTGQILAHYQPIYSSKLLEYQLMNSIVAMALMNVRLPFETVDYIIPYYVHCLRSFASTLFGQCYMSNHEQFTRIMEQTIQVYQVDSSDMCASWSDQKGEQINDIFMEFLIAMLGPQGLLRDDDDDLTNQKIDSILFHANRECYFKCSELLFLPSVKQSMQNTANDSMRIFLELNKDTEIYGLIYQEFLEQEQLVKDMMTTEEEDNDIDID